MDVCTSRRRFLCGAAALGFFLLAPRRSSAAVTPVRSLAFSNLHTGEALRVVYREGDAYVPGALASLDHLLRDHRTGEVHPIEPALFDLLADLREATGGGTFEVISGYRSGATNQILRGQGGGVAEKSLHLVGRAIDVRLRGVETAQLRRAALALRRGGVGFYPALDFVHVDTGRVRFW
jgi:uncharacterized protein YcbK (DUF882 family)